MAELEGASTKLAQLTCMVVKSAAFRRKGVGALQGAYGRAWEKTKRFQVEKGCTTSVVERNPGRGQGQEESNDY